jgi:phosphohistidine phosphatase SixA
MRQLAEAGRAQAQAIGEALRTLQIPVGQVLASPYCRTVETAELLAMGPVTATTDLLNMYAADYVGGRAQVIATTRRLLSTPPQPGTNTVLVSHGNVLHGATNISLAEGEAAIFVPAGADTFTLVARVLAEAWPALLPAGPAETGEVATAEASPLPATATPEICEPTPPDGLGPFYVPNAPERSSVGQGHLLSGVVRSSLDCAPIPGAQIEFWLAGPDGQYGDAYRAIVFANNLGAYRFESHFPPAYSGRPAHIHLRISANGYQTLVTQYYPAEGQVDGSFDLVLLSNN